MATPTLRISVFSNGSHSITRPPAPVGNLWHVKTDAELRRYDRFSMPMVFFFRETKCDIPKEWQLFICAINYGMLLQYIAALLNNGRMTCNGGDGFGSVAHCNWILGRDLLAPPPRWSKVFTCGGATVEVIDGVVTMFDGSVPPPLRDGLSYPLTRAQAMDPASYKYIPQRNPELFYATVDVNDDFTPIQWREGALYPWYKDGRTPVSFLPHVADKRFGEVRYPPDQFSGNSAILARI